MKERLRQEIKDHAAIQVGLLTSLLILNAVLTPRQRYAIREERDEGRCQAPAEHDCGGKNLQVHHISPQRWEADIFIPEDVRDRPENLITLCENFHAKEVHPDIETARRNYGMDKKSYQKTFQYRNELVAERKPYWNQEHDVAMFSVAKERTEHAKQNGWKYPGKNERQTPQNPL